jgi:hypothetical protein
MEQNRCGLTGYELNLASLSSTLETIRLRVQVERAILCEGGRRGGRSQARLKKVGGRSGMLEKPKERSGETEAA